jgi:hypothetical protein
MNEKMIKLCIKSYEMRAIMEIITMKLEGDDRRRFTISVMPVHLVLENKCPKCKGRLVKTGDTYKCRCGVSLDYGLVEDAKRVSREYQHLMKGVKSDIKLNEREKAECERIKKEVFRKAYMKYTGKVPEVYR